MKVCELFEEIRSDKEISGIFHDSRKIIPDSVFVCLEGENDDGHNHIKEAQEKGAAVIY